MGRGADVRHRRGSRSNGVLLIRADCGGERADGIVLIRTDRGEGRADGSRSNGADHLTRQ